jgi:hypothetical protein
MVSQEKSLLRNKYKGGRFIFNISPFVFVEVDVLLDVFGNGDASTLYGNASAFFFFYDV